MINLLKKLSKIFKIFETSLLIFFLSLIILISFSQIILRNFSVAVLWFDSLLKYSVLWAGMIAAEIATSENKHIKIDIIGRFTKGKLKIIVSIITNIFSCIVCIVMFILFILYIFTIENNSKDNNFLNIHKSVLLIILPVSFFVMSFRFLFHSIKNIKSLISYGKENSSESAIKSEGLI